MASPAPIVPCNDRNISIAAQIIRDGGLIGFGTETVYGLGADATNGEAVARIFAAKGRPSFNPLISHVPNVDAVAALANIPTIARDIADKYWPGPLTLVFRKASNCPISDLTTAGLNTVAVRIPGRDAARDLLDACAVPVAAPSANASGAISPTRAEHVSASLPGPADGGPKLILDMGPSDVGLESTVLDVTTSPPALLRPGGITIEDIEALVGPIDIAGTDDIAPRSPGMMSRHYAPTTPLRMNATSRNDGEVLLGFGPTSLHVEMTLSESGDLIEASAHLFEMLHHLDAMDATGIAVMPIPDTGLGLAINDRLRRAATM